jgi:lysophospholipase L1-like esterase
MKSYKILLFTALVMVLLAILSMVFPKEGIAFSGRRLFFPSLEEVTVKEKGLSVTEKMQELETQLAIKDSIKDSIKNVFADSLKFFTDFFESNPARIYLPNDDLTYFDEVFEAIDSVAPEHTVHILHYGDSQIESDRITGYLRQCFQERFGGNGPGLLPLVQPIPSLTVSQESLGLSRYLISGNLANKASHNRYGLLAQMSELRGYGSISIQPRKTKNVFDSLQTFSLIRLFISRNSAGFEARLKTNDKSAPSIKIIKEASNEMKTLTWQLSAPVKRISLQMSGSAELTAIALDGMTGVAVDNIPLRGSSGTFFTDIDASSMLPAMKELDVRLILLEFGGNAVPSIKSEKSIEYYKKNIARQIVRLREIYPKARILFVGPSDMSTKIRGKLQTYPHLPQIVEGLKEAALENGAAFWNMYDVMGGENSMIKWAKEKPALASPDHIHFTQKGVDRIADLLFKSLIIYYNYSTFIKNKPEENY